MRHFYSCSFFNIKCEKRQNVYGQVSKPTLGIDTGTQRDIAQRPTIGDDRSRQSQSCNRAGRLGQGSMLMLVFPKLEKVKLTIILYRTRFEVIVRQFVEHPTCRDGLVTRFTAVRFIPYKISAKRHGRLKLVKWLTYAGFTYN